MDKLKTLICKHYKEDLPLARKQLCQHCAWADGGLCRYVLLPITAEGLPCPYFACREAITP